MNGNVLNNGNFGVWTTSSFNRDNFAQIGGSYEGENYAPSINPDSNVTRQNHYLPDGFPDSPDKIMGGDSEGYSEGTLLSLAQSGSNGSQYVTDPGKLNYPLKGITYVDLSSDTPWDCANIEGSGILIVHNSGSNSLISNVSGTFKGVVIADDINQVSGNIIGGLITISSEPQNGSVCGFGNGQINYSSQAIKSATKTLGKVQIASGDYRLKIDYWLESNN